MCVFNLFYMLLWHINIFSFLSAMISRSLLTTDNFDSIKLFELNDFGWWQLVVIYRDLEGGSPIFLGISQYLPEDVVQNLPGLPLNRSWFKQYKSVRFITVLISPICEVNSVRNMTRWWGRMRVMDTETKFDGVCTSHAFKYFRYANDNVLFELRRELFLLAFLVCFALSYFYILSV
jgi:hypothetical protein